MKTFTLLLIPFVVFAMAETMTPEEHKSIHTQSKRPSIKLMTKREMHRLHKITEEEAVQSAKKETGEESRSVKLAHKNEVLFFEVTTENYRVLINALDGTLIEKAKQ